MSSRRCIVGFGLGGLALGSAVIATSFNRWAEDNVFDEPLHVLAAIPPFIIPIFENLPDPVVIQTFLLWWVLAGAMIGSLAGRGRKGLAAAVVALTVLASGHVYTRVLIGERVDFARADEGSEYSYLIRWLVD